MYAQSSVLKGADNREFPGTYHNDLRMDPAIVAEYRQFIEAAELAMPEAHGYSIAAGALSLGGVLALALIGGLRRRR